MSLPGATGAQVSVTCRSEPRDICDGHVPKVGEIVTLTLDGRTHYHQVIWVSERQTASGIERTASLSPPYEDAACTRRAR